MEDWQTRVVEERAELDSKITKLSAFTTQPSSTFSRLEEIDKLLMEDQLAAMREYCAILDQRIMRFRT